MREEMLVLRGQNRRADNRRDLLISGELAGLRRHLLERLAIDVVDAPDCGEFKAREFVERRQIVSIPIDVIYADGRQRAGQSGCGEDDTNQAAPPACRLRTRPVNAP